MDVKSYSKKIHKNRYFMFKNIWVDPQEILSNFYFQLRILQLSVKQMLIL